MENLSHTTRQILIGVWQRLTPKQREWFLKVKRSKVGVKVSAAPRRTVNELVRLGVLMRVETILTTTYRGEQLYEVGKQARKARSR